ncbi:Uncharacterised protein [Streptococcus pneumoniae]|nr:Uncharacterised protein [Streptococcus pneumoniae]
MSEAVINPNPVLMPLPVRNSLPPFFSAIAKYGSKVAHASSWPALKAAAASVGRTNLTLTSSVDRPSSFSASINKYCAILPFADETTTVFPFKSFIDLIEEFFLTNIPTASGEDTLVAIIFNGTFEAAAASTGVSPAGAVSTDPAFNASNKGAAP